MPRDVSTLTSKLQWTALVMLVLAVAALLVVLMSQQRSYRAEAESQAEAFTAGSSQSASGDASPAPSESDGASNGDGGDEEEETEEASADPVEAATAAAQDVVNGSEDIEITVLGDSTSDSDGEWVTLWAQELGADATVQVHTWNPATGTWFQEPREFGEGDRQITLWNASAAEGNPGFALELDGMIAAESDLTILNYGHFGDPDFVAATLGNLLDELDAGGEDAAPVVLTAQNPALDTWTGWADTNREAMRDAAQERDLPVIDVFAAFDKADDWQSLLTDEVHPNDDGQRLWADTVTEFFAS